MKIKISSKRIIKSVFTITLFIVSATAHAKGLKIGVALPVFHRLETSLKVKSEIRALGVNQSITDQISDRVDVAGYIFYFEARPIDFLAFRLSHSEFTFDDSHVDGRVTAIQVGSYTQFDHIEAYGFIGIGRPSLDTRRRNLNVKEKTGNAFIIDIGLNYLITQRLSIELGYQRVSFNREFTLEGEQVRPNVDFIKVKIDTEEVVSGLKLGVGFHF